MQYVPPLGGNPNDSYVEGNPTAGIRGSFPTATGYEAMMREICNLETLSGYQGASNADLPDIQDLYQAVLLMIKNHPSPNSARYASSMTCGFSLENFGDQTIPVNQETPINFQAINDPPSVCTYANGFTTIVEPGWYDCSIGSAILAASTHAVDAARMHIRINLLRNGVSFGGMIDSRHPTFQPPGTNGAGTAAANFVTSLRTPLLAGDKVQFLAYGSNLYDDCTSVKAVAYTNAEISFLNLDG